MARVEPPVHGRLDDCRLGVDRRRVGEVMRWVAWGLLASSALVLSGCGGGASSEPTSRITLDGPSTSAPPSPTATSKGDKPVDDELHVVKDPATTPAQKAVVAVWTSYWTELLRMYATLDVNEDYLYSIATDQGASGPLDYVADMRSRHTHEAGGLVAGINTVKVTGRRAVVQTCFRTTAHEVDRKGRDVEHVLPFLSMKEVLTKEGPDWRVSHSYNLGDSPCAVK